MGYVKALFVLQVVVVVVVVAAAVVFRKES
jgi:hypothetical protein